MDVFLLILIIFKLNFILFLLFLISFFWFSFSNEGGRRHSLSTLEENSEPPTVPGIKIPPGVPAPYYGNHSNYMLHTDLVTIAAAPSYAEDPMAITPPLSPSLSPTISLGEYEKDTNNSNNGNTIMESHNNSKTH